MNKKINKIIKEIEKAKTIDDGHIGMALIDLYALRENQDANCEENVGGKE